MDKIKKLHAFNNSIAGEAYYIIYNKYKRTKHIDALLLMHTANNIVKDREQVKPAKIDYVIQKLSDFVKMYCKDKDINRGEYEDN